MNDQETGWMLPAPHAQWRKSSYSAANGGVGDGCVEVSLDAVVGVRDTKQRGQGPVLDVSRPAWAAFTAVIKAGEIDHA